jgi:hypothetical protein
MKRLILALLVTFFAQSAHAYDVAYAPTKVGILIMTNDRCKTTKPKSPEIKVLQIRHESKTEVANGCYVLTPDGKITAKFDNGDVYEYDISSFTWTPDAIEQLRNIEETEQKQQSNQKPRKIFI